MVNLDPPGVSKQLIAHHPTRSRGRFDSATTPARGGHAVATRPANEHAPVSTRSRDVVLSRRGRDLIDTDADKIGSIEDVYLDRENDEPEWSFVTTGLFGNERRYVPLSDGQPIENRLKRVAWHWRPRGGLIQFVQNAVRPRDASAQTSCGEATPSRSQVTQPSLRRDEIGHLRGAPA